MILDVFDDETVDAFTDQLRTQVQRGKFGYLKDLLRFAVPIKQATELTGADGQQLNSAADVVAMIQSALAAKAGNGDNDGQPGR